MNPTLKKISKSESVSGMLLLLVALIAFVSANSTLREIYHYLVHLPIAIDLGMYSFTTTLHHAINDGLMVIFFYYVGLEIKKEILIGELSDPRKSSFAIFAAIGGMIVPALIYACFNSGTEAEHGWGIPMATDIAFAVGVLALLGKRIPTELKIFLLALAIVDDLGAVLVIALFYTKDLSPLYLLFTILPLAIIYFRNKKSKISFYPAVALGIIVWFCILKSGIHATIAGVLLAFFTPLTVTLEDGSKHNPLEHWAHTLQPYINLMIMPIFAFFNAGVELGDTTVEAIFAHPIAQGVIWGLFLGKPIGILSVCYLSSKLGIARPPQGVSWKQVLGVGMLAGIGFTMSLFVSGLSFSNPDFELYSKSGIMMASILSGIFGFTFLLLVTKRGT